MARLAIDHVSLQFGGVAALRDVSFSIDAGEICAVIGPNGAGKTSLVNCVSGVIARAPGRSASRARTSRAWARRANALGIARTFQNIALFKGMTVLDNLLIGRHFAENGDRYRGPVYRPGARRSRPAAGRRGDLDFLEIEHVRKAVVHTLSTACRSGSSSPAPWPSSPGCFCSTSPWPA